MTETATGAMDTPRITPKSRNGIGDLIVAGSLGTLSAWFGTELLLTGNHAKYDVLVTAIIFALAYRTRLRPGVSAISAAAAIGLLIIAFTPIVRWLVNPQYLPDQLEKADAVVSLGAGINGDGTVSSMAHDRTTHSFSLLREGYAPTLVLTGGEEQGGSIIRREMDDLGFHFPVIDAGPVVNTHDEALAVATLARQRSWNRVILVTNAWHMRRAAAVFRKAGVSVICSPCQDTGGNVTDPQRLHDRVRILGLWLHEVIGYRVYSMRGWI